VVSAPLLVRLRPGREKPWLQGHPWLYSGAIAAVEGDAEAALARVVASDGRDLGVGFWNPRSQVRVRGLGAGWTAADVAYFAARLERAAELRRAVVPPETTGYRVLNAEGDGVPGWTIDRFADVLVSQVTCAGLEGSRTSAYAALRAAFPGAAVVQANRLPARRLEELAQADEVIAGQPPPEVEFRERGLRFLAQPLGGQKTGFYCDQRDNRALAERLAAGRSMLDLFAHAGACAVAALRGGATRVTAVESGGGLEDRARRQLELNRLAAERFEWVRADVFEDLRVRTERYGLVVCDPPPLARRQSDVERAARAYKDLNRLALGRVESGGFLLTFSCSGAVDAKLFRQVLFAAATEAGVEAALLQPLAAAPDHPVGIAHPEGEYLKGWWVAVRSRAPG